MKNVFDPVVGKELIGRVESLSPDSLPVWGKMNVAQMFAHVNVTYEMAYTDKHPHAKGIKRLLLNLFVKPSVVNTVPYRRNLQTAPAFRVPSQQDFEKQKQRLIDHITKTYELGADHFEGKPSPSFGKLTHTEWSNMMYKHLDHHLGQFGA